MLPLTSVNPLASLQPQQAQEVTQQPDFAGEQAALERRERLLQAMLGQGQQVPAQQYQPLNAIADVVRAFVANKKGGELQEERSQLAGRMTADRGASMQRIAQALAKGDTSGMVPLAGNWDPNVSEAAMKGVATLSKPTAERNIQTRKRSLGDGTFQDEEFVGGKWQPFGKPYQSATDARTDLSRDKWDRENKENKAKASGFASSFTDKADLVDELIDEALANADEYTAGLAGSAAAKVPGSKAYNLSETLGAIQANIGFEALQEMRRNSPTGGALGQVAVQELDYLQKTLSSIKQAQDAPQLRKNLERVRREFKKARDRLERTYQQTYDEALPRNVQEPPTTVPKVGDVMDGYRFKGGDPSVEASWEKVTP